MTTFSFWQSTANRPPKRPVPRGSRCSRLCEARPGCLMLPHRHLRRSLCAAAAGNDLVRLMQRLRVPYGSLGACTPHETAYQLCTTCSLLHECALFRFSIPVAPLPRATHACRVLQGASTDQTSVPHCAGRACVGMCMRVAPPSYVPLRPLIRSTPSAAPQEAQSEQAPRDTAVPSRNSLLPPQPSGNGLSSNWAAVTAALMQRAWGRGREATGEISVGKEMRGQMRATALPRGGAWGKGLAGKRCWILLCVKNCKRAPMLLSRRGIKKMCVCAPPPPTVVTLRPQICVIVRVGVEV